MADYRSAVARNTEGGETGQFNKGQDDDDDDEDPLDAFMTDLEVSNNIIVIIHVHVCVCMCILVCLHVV